MTHHSDVIKQRTLRHAFAPIRANRLPARARVLSDSPPYIDGSDLLQRFRDKVETVPMGLDLAFLAGRRGGSGTPSD